MKFYPGLDISMEATTVCVPDSKGRVFREAIVESTPGVGGLSQRLLRWF